MRCVRRTRKDRGLNYPTPTCYVGKCTKALNFNRYKTFVTLKSVTFEIFRKCSESVNFDANIDLQEDLKIFKSDTFENYKSFVPVEVQSLLTYMNLLAHSYFDPVE